NSSSWTYVWEVVWDDSGDRRLELGAKLEKWLTEAPLSNPAWPVVWRKLWGTNTLGGSLQEVGLRWLENSFPNDSNWGLIFHALCRRGGADVLPKLGLRWLAEAAPEHVGWPHVWQDLIATLGLTTELAALGEHWIEIVPSHLGWKFVWQ